jgi:hypothetical protein
VFCRVFCLNVLRAVPHSLWNLFSLIFIYFFRQYDTLKPKYLKLYTCSIVLLSVTILHPMCYFSPGIPWFFVFMVEILILKPLQSINHCTYAGVWLYYNFIHHLAWRKSLSKNNTAIGQGSCGGYNLFGYSPLSWSERCFGGRFLIRLHAEGRGINSAGSIWCRLSSIPEATRHHREIKIPVVLHYSNCEDRNILLSS